MQAGPSTASWPPPGKEGPGFDGYGQQPPPQQAASYYAPAGYPQQQQQQQQWAPYPAAPAAGAAIAGSGSGGGAVSHSFVVRVDPDHETATSFADKVVRNGFVRKVFGIVGLQLAFTAGIAALFMFNSTLRLYVRHNQWVFWVAWILAFAFILFLSFAEKARRTWPTNMVLLGAFTAVQAFLVGTMTAFYSQEAVIIAFSVTAAAVVALSLFAMQTKIDATKWGSILLVGLVALLVLMLIGLVWRSKILYLVLSGVGALLFSAYLIYDIQLVMGGRYYSISPDEYVFAALNIYLDIINLFMMLLSLIGLAGGNN